ncbi:putative ribonuclease H protein, partial [Trifolium medium]|nr:putative ribonuclease H protein [Trifolium medium]
MEWDPTPISYPALEENIMSDLAAPHNNDEIKHAVFSMSPWKAPGPDGFPAGFYQKSWDIVGRSVCDFVRKVWTTPSEIGVVNKTDICLIPKVQHPESVVQFRPISLCNMNYKIVSKVIVERLKVCIPMLVSPFQTGFVPGRNIHENIVVAKEMIHTMHRMQSSKGAFAIKVDLSKAYDKISWECIWRILCEIKLPDQLINLIMHSVTSVETNVKWNGARGEFFRPQRGIRQGDPISPYLFVLCMDKLSHLIMHAANIGKWRGIKAGRAGPMVSHLMFADDLLLFGEASEKQMQCVLDILNEFCSLSGQEAVPIYPMMTEKIPKACLEDIQRIQRNFIWGEYDNVRKYHAVNWNMVTLPKWMGGLGLRKLEVVKGKYGVHDFSNDIAIKPSASSLWKGLVKIERSSNAQHNLLYNVPAQLQGARVRDLVDVNGSWNWQLLETWIPETIMNKIAAIPPPCEENGSDEPVGICNNSNGYSVTAMYEQMCGTVRDNADSIWIKVWNLNVPERVRCFVWLGGDWCDFWGTACHSLWTWRNKEAHDDEFLRPIHPLNYVHKRIEEYQHAKQASDLLEGRECTRVEIGWKPPSGSFVRLNTDGARKENNK